MLRSVAGIPLTKKRVAPEMWSFVGLRCCLAAGYALWLTVQAAAQTQIEVSPMWQVYREYARTAVPAGQFNLVQIGSLRAGTVISGTLHASKEGSSLVWDIVPTADVEAWGRARQGMFNSIDRDRAVTTPAPVTRQIVQEGNYTLVFYGDNWWFENNINANLWMLSRLTPDEQKGLYAWAQQLVSEVDKRFEMPRFKVTIRPCGDVNASSEFATGNILICSELLDRLRTSENALRGIFFHELGHTLLTLWGLPGERIEDLADEFAVFMLLQLRGGPGMASDLGDYFKTSSDPWAHFYQILQGYEPHSLGIQRARNIDLVLRDPPQSMERWNSQVYPHMRTEHLVRIIQDPRPYGSKEIAEYVLKVRRQ